MQTALVALGLFSEEEIKEQLRDWKNSNVEQIAEELQKKYGLEDFFVSLKSMAHRYVSRRVGLSNISRTVFQRYSTDWIGSKKLPQFLRERTKQKIRKDLGKHTNAKVFLSVALLSSFLDSSKVLEILKSESKPDNLVDMAVDKAFDDWEKAYGGQYFFRDNVKNQILDFIKSINPSVMVMATAFIIKQNTENPERLAAFIHSLGRFTVKEILQYQEEFETFLREVSASHPGEAKRLSSLAANKTSRWRQRSDHDAIPEEGNLGRGGFLFSGNGGAENNPSILHGFEGMIDLICKIAVNFVPKRNGDKMNVNTGFMSDLVKAVAKPG